MREARSLLYLTLTDAARLLFWHLPFAQHTALLSGVLVPGALLLSRMPHRARTLILTLTLTLTLTPTLTLTLRLTRASLASVRHAADASRGAIYVCQACGRRLTRS